MSRNFGRYNRVFRATYGDGPWECVECHETIFEMGQASEKGCIHHKDEDYENDVADNLEPMHNGCHMKHHLKGVPKSPEHREKVAETRRALVAANGGKIPWMTAESHRKTGDALRGIPRSDEVKAKISAGWARRREMREREGKV